MSFIFLVWHSCKVEYGIDPTMFSFLKHLLEGKTSWLVFSQAMWYMHFRSICTRGAELLGSPPSWRTNNQCFYKPLRNRSQICAAEKTCTSQMCRFIYFIFKCFSPVNCSQGECENHHSYVYLNLLIMRLESVYISMFIYVYIYYASPHPVHLWDLSTFAPKLLLIHSMVLPSSFVRSWI